MLPTGVANQSSVRAVLLPSRRTISDPYNVVSHQPSVMLSLRTPPTPASRENLYP